MVCGKESMISGCSSYSKVFLGCSCVDCPCFMQPCSSYSKVFLGCSRVGLPLLYAALFFIFKGVLGLLLLRVALALCSPVLHIQRCFWGCSCVGCPYFMQPCSSYSKVFFSCPYVGLSLLYAALFFIFKVILGYSCVGLPLRYAATFAFD